MKTVNQAVKILEKSFPDISGFKPAGPWGGSSDYDQAIHLGDLAEGGTIDGMPGADYYSFEWDSKEEFYVFGVHKKLIAELEKLGYYPECYDPGTWLAWPI